MSVIELCATRVQQKGFILLNNPRLGDMRDLVSSSPLNPASPDPRCWSVHSSFTIYTQVALTCVPPAESLVFLFPQTPCCEEWFPRAKLAQVLFPLGDAWAGGADGGNWWWVFGNEIKIHSGGRGGGTCSERYTAAHLDHERAVIDEGSHQCWICSGKAAVSVTPERCLSKETAFKTCTENLKNEERTSENKSAV